MLVVLPVILVSVSAVSMRVKTEWQEWKEMYGKAYPSPQEDASRFAIFQANAIAAAELTRRNPLVCKFKLHKNFIVNFAAGNMAREGYMFFVVVT